MTSLKVRSGRPRPSLSELRRGNGQLAFNSLCRLRVLRATFSPFIFRVPRVFRGSHFLNSKLKSQNSKLEKLVAALLGWFSRNARDLPWRRTHDPYAIWVSEIMLQQTQVKTVIPYWERWMRELPTIQSAAKASPAKLHKLWEGLGYYTRVRNLQRAAQQIVAQHDGRFPEDFNAILALPGIGRYTAGAICSIAFNQPKPILDGNVIRVLTRVFGITTDPRKKKTNAHLWQLAAELVVQAKTLAITNCAPWTAAGSEAPRRFGRLRHLPKAVSPLRSATAVQKPQSPGESNSCSFLNQSLMELGALICTPRSPNCTACPVRKFCVARKENLQDKLPTFGKHRAATERRFVAFVVERDGKFLVRQRPAGVVNAHLWEFPNVEVGPRLSEPQRPRRNGRLADSKKPQQDGVLRLGQPRSGAVFRITCTEPLCVIKHSITRYRITLEAWRARLTKPSTKIPGRWLAPKQLHRLAFTSAHKKILARLSA